MTLVDYKSVAMSELQQAKEAIQQGRREDLQQLLMAGLDANSDLEETTLLIEAIVHKNVDIVELLLQHGADINKGSAWLVTPLCAAAATNNLTMAELLISKGCDMTKLSDNRPVYTIATPLHFAIHNKNVPMAKLLLENNHNPNVPSNQRHYPIIEAIKQDCIEIVQLLLNTPSCRTTNITPSLGGLEYPPLYQSLFIYRKYHIAETILDSKRCLLIFMGDSYLSLMIRRAFDNSFLILKTAKLLLEAGCDMECHDRYQYPPFVTLVKANKTIFEMRVMKPLMLLFINAGIYPDQYAVSLLREFAIHEEDVNFVNWLENKINNPRTLAELCRQYLRNFFGVFPKDKIAQLPLPEPLLDYVSLANLRSFYG